MGYGKAIRLPGLAWVKMFAPKAVYNAAAARLPKNSFLKTDVSLRYEMLGDQHRSDFESFGTFSTQGLNNQAKVFGVAAGMTSSFMSSMLNDVGMGISNFTPLPKSVLGLAAVAGVLSILLKEPEIFSSMIESLDLYGKSLGLASLPILGMAWGGTWRGNRYELDPLDGVGKDLATFEENAPTLAETKGLTDISRDRARFLESVFESGGEVYFHPKLGFQVMILPSGAHTFGGEPASPADLAYFHQWKAERSFQEATDPTVGQWAWEQLQKRAQQLGIAIKMEGNAGPLNKDFFSENGAQFLLAHQTLSLLPDSMLKNPKLREIHLNTARSDPGKLSCFTNGRVYLYRGTFLGARRHLVGMLLHELGHSTAHRYFEGPQGDKDIPEPVRDKMAWAHQVLVNRWAMIGLDHAGGPDYRKSYQIDFEEFLAEMNLIYVAAGPRLRKHIQSFPEGSEVKTAWEFVYHEMQNRIFSGVEFGYQKSE